MNKNTKRRLVERKQSYIPTLIATGILWFICILIIFTTEPEKFTNQVIFLVIFFLTLFFTFTVAFASKKRGLLASLSIIIFLILSYFGVGTIINLALITGIAVSVDRLTA